MLSLERISHARNLVHRGVAERFRADIERIWIAGHFTEFFNGDDELILTAIESENDKWNGINSMRNKKTQ